MDEYLQSLGIELWPGVSFYLTDPSERAKAVQWLEELVNDLKGIEDGLHV